MAHVPLLWGQVCGPGAQSYPSAEGWEHQRTVVRWVSMDYRFRGYGLYYKFVIYVYVFYEYCKPSAEGLRGVACAVVGGVIFIPCKLLTIQV